MPPHPFDVHDSREGEGEGGRHPPGDPGPWSLNAPWVAAPSSRCSPRRYFSTFSLSLFLSNLFFSIKSFILKNSLCVEFVCLYFGVLYYLMGPPGTVFIGCRCHLMCGGEPRNWCHHQRFAGPGTQHHVYGHTRGETQTAKKQGQHI